MAKSRGRFLPSIQVSVRGNEFLSQWLASVAKAEGRSQADIVADALYTAYHEKYPAETGVFFRNRNGKYQRGKDKRQ